MRLAEYLSRELLIADLNADTKEGALAAMVDKVASVIPEVDSGKALAVLLDRERLGTTGIGEGIAIPHGRLAGLPQILVLMARSVRGVPFEALDHKPCHLFFLVFAPEGGSAGQHLRILAQISRLGKNLAFCRSLIDAPSPDELWQVLTEV